MKYEGLAPTSCCCEHTHVCCRISKLGVAQGSGVTRAWPTRCCCEHTHVCFRKNPIHSRLHPRINSCMGLADELLLRAYTCVCGRITSQLKACTKDQKGTRVWPTNCCCEHTHMCVRNSSRLHPRITGYTGLAVQLREYVKSRLHSRPKGYKCLADRVLL